MRNVSKDPLIPDELIDIEAQKHYENILKTKKVTENSCKVNRKINLKLFKNYNGKCCYCESKVTGIEIEHYRPKSKYYWLAYSWDNLMLVCSHCNKAKGDKFPLSAKAIATHGRIKKVNAVQNIIKSYNIKELPLIINPEIDTINPSIFSFSKKGVMKANDKGGRFTQTINEIDLNHKVLLYWRKKFFDELIKKHLGFWTDPQIDDIEAKEKKLLQTLVKNSMDFSKDHTALRNYLVKYYRGILIKGK